MDSCDQGDDALPQKIKSNQNIYLHGHKIRHFRKVRCVF